ncbi:RNA polymerase sigma factor SigJ [Paenibacillus sp. JX-17]|uniref:RNA polymerase sigma factor SigJ n=1 Tax=Paenibacillus lacisoli TaxID=3064525 RepID=A0ABT9CEP5_9BACL|nr:RNA polymerase sigma factor SigJ [Paenibacillus sp. JX-17]MDO7907743.1 RNA polymerase sigma factor SigJ [Paenibacillus sp. JX-17]
MVELDFVYRSYKPLLLSIAYRMLGSVAQAEDLVQDVFVTVQQQRLYKDDTSVSNCKAYLCKMITNRCLDFLKSNRFKRETYVGPWLPEPLVEPYADPSGAGASLHQDPLQTVLLEDTISYAFLILLDQLTPVERAVFILREAFEFDYHDIAHFVDKTEPGCRKIYSRLKRKIQAEPAADQIPGSQHKLLVTSFLQAVSTGDMEKLLALLSDDIVLYSDGGGKVLAAVKPITSSQRVIGFIQGILSKSTGTETFQLVKINGEPGFIISGPSEPFPTVVSLAFIKGKIGRIYLIRNPEKLQHLHL